MAAMKDFIQSAAGTTSMSNELAELADLPDAGTIDDADFAAAKARLVGRA